MVQGHVSDSSRSRARSDDAHLARTSLEVAHARGSSHVGTVDERCPTSSRRDHHGHVRRRPIEGTDAADMARRSSGDHVSRESADLPLVARRPGQRQWKGQHVRVREPQHGDGFGPGVVQFPPPHECLLRSCPAVDGLYAPNRMSLSAQSTCAPNRA